MAAVDASAHPVAKSEDRRSYGAAIQDGRAAWTQQTILVSSDGTADDLFGTAVAVDGDTAVIGAPAKTVGTHARQGQAYVFVRSGTAWVQQAILVGPAATSVDPDYFGFSVAVSGDTVVIGSPKKLVGVNANQGQAYVFVRSGTSWSQQALLVDAATGAGRDSFGISVAVSGDTAIIGAHTKKVGANLEQGQAYVFVRSGTSWSQQTILVDSVTGAKGDNFGNSVALSGDTAVIGAVYKQVGISMAAPRTVRSRYVCHRCIDRISA